MITILALSLANASISYTISKSNLLFPIRNFFFLREHIMMCRFVSQLISCTYCFSHWVALIMIYVWQPTVTHTYLHIFDLIISMFIVVTLTTIIWGIFHKLME